MTLSSNSLRASGVFGLLAAVALALLVVPSMQAQIPDIVVDIADTTAMPGETNAVISIYFDNFVDTVAGFNLWVQLDRPDIMLFQTDADTMIDTTYWECLEWDGADCVDSVMTNPGGNWDFIHEDTNEVLIGNHDTTGTLCSGWELVDSRSISGQGIDLNIMGIADCPGGDITPGIPAGQQGGILIKILADVFDIPDSTTDRTVTLMIQTQFKDHFGFSRPDGSSIGWIQQEVEDTICYQCTQWGAPPYEDSCLNWIEVSFGVCDSTEIVLDTITVLDTIKVKIFNGSQTVLVPEYVCGNIDGSDPPEIDVGDLLYLVEYMFNSGPPPEEELTADMNCDGEVDISDLLMMVEWMFNFGPEICPDC